VSAPILVPAGGGEVIGDSEWRRVEILSDDESLNATWSRFAAGREGADLHVHRRHYDLFYVLAGELTVRLGAADERVVAPAGSLAIAPPLVVHGFLNAGGAELRFLNFHAPGMGFADYMRGRRDGLDVSYDQHPPPADGGRPAPAEVVVAPALVELDEIAVAEVVAGAPAPEHVHRGHVESLYVLEGELAVSAGGRELRAGAGAWVQIPAGVPHAYAAAAPAPARFLEVHTPAR
jgi:quercetin dioxygenase-like cupin family protein